MPLFFLALVVLSFANEVAGIVQLCLATLQGSDDACILLSTIVGSGGGTSWRGMRRTSMRRAPLGTFRRRRKRRGGTVRLRIITLLLETA
jgi:hypothetical protein